MGGGAFSQWATQAVWRVICTLGSTGTVQGGFSRLRLTQQSSGPSAKRPDGPRNICTSH